MVVAIMGILAFIIISAVNPSRQLGKARDAQRKSDVLGILIAFYQYTLDHGGDHPVDIPFGESNAKGICRTNVENCNNGINLRSLTGAYVADLPLDPHADDTGTGTSYYMYAQADNRVTVFAPLAEKEFPIQSTR